jgi:Mn-dependent DtxR family transcriptional regulator
VSVLEDLRGIEARVIARLKELRPLVEEYAELQRVAERLGVEVPSTSREPPRAAKPRSRKPATAARKQDSRRRPGGTQATGAERRARVLALIEQRPGISVPEIAGDIGVDAPPIYRVVRKLQAESIVIKKGKGLELA